MLSLLIISNNPKAKLIQDFIQPLVETDISLVADFELGLSEVFEKNPATVIIQEQIDGVACDAIALYIKQMFGKDAPTFIMAHEGNARIKPVKGLYDVFVDLNQTNEALVAEVSSVLKRIIGGEQVENADLLPSPQLPEEPANIPVEVHIVAETLTEVVSPEPIEPAHQKLSVLLVENNIIDQRVALTMLSNLGCEVDIVSDGQKAIHSLELINYDMVFMNLVLPRMDGLETTAMIRDKRSQVLNHEVPIIALASTTKPGDREKCLDAGMNAYLEKPVNKAYLAEAIEKWARMPLMGGAAETVASEVFPPEEVAKRTLKKKASRTTKALNAAATDTLSSNQVAPETADTDALDMAQQNAAKLEIIDREQLEQARRRIEELERIVTEKMLEVENSKELLHTERVARIEVEEALLQARINNDALNEQLQTEVDRRKKIEEAFDQAQSTKDIANELFQAEFTLRTDAEETLSLVRTAAEAADRESETVIKHLQDERDTWKQLESSLEQADSERTLELQTTNELLQAERTARNVAEKKLDQALIAAETLNKQVEFVNEYLEAERAERKTVEIRLKEVEELLAKLIADMQTTPAGTVSESVAAMVDRHKEATYHTSPTWTDDNPFDTVSTSRSRLSVFLLTALLVLCVAGGWYLFGSRPQSPVRTDQPKTVAPTGTPAPVAEKPTALKQPAPPAADSSIPSFVTVSSRDDKYSAENPGWERYVDAKHDIRIYREAGRLKAVQVLAAKDQVVLDSFMRTALHEMTGDSDYKRLSSETKMGFMIQRNGVGSNSRLIVYRKLPSNKIRAFVVQLE